MLSVFRLKDITIKSIEEHGHVEFYPQTMPGGQSFIFMKTKTGYKSFQMSGFKIYNRQTFNSLAKAKTNVNKST